MSSPQKRLYSIIGIMGVIIVYLGYRLIQSPQYHLPYSSLNLVEGTNPNNPLTFECCETGVANLWNNNEQPRKEPRRTFDDIYRNNDIVVVTIEQITTTSPVIDIFGKNNNQQKYREAVRKLNDGTAEVFELSESEYRNNILTQTQNTEIWIRTGKDKGCDELNTNEVHFTWFQGRPLPIEHFLPYTSNNKNNNARDTVILVPIKGGGRRPPPGH